MMVRMLLLWMGVLSLSISGLAAEPVNGEAGQADVQLMQQFDTEEELAPERAISTQRKHEILFLMGAALLLLIFVTAGLGMAMALWEKDVFTWHMLSAGLTVTLAIVHAVVSFVWFYPE